MISLWRHRYKISNLKILKKFRACRITIQGNRILDQHYSQPVKVHKPQGQEKMRHWQDRWRHHIHHHQLRNPLMGQVDLLLRDTKIVLKIFGHRGSNWGHPRSNSWGQILRSNPEVKSWGQILWLNLEVKSSGQSRVKIEVNWGQNLEVESSDQSQVEIEVKWDQPRSSGLNWGQLRSKRDRNRGQTRSFTGVCSVAPGFTSSLNKCNDLLSSFCQLIVIIIL